jgi:hypothetical protein
MNMLKKKNTDAQEFDWLKTNISYDEFLEKKEVNIQDSGFEVSDEELSPYLFDYQKDIIKWALRKGKSALFEDTGLGKTIQQLQWATSVHKHTNKPVMIFAPLAVSKQTVLEGEKFNLAVNLCEDQGDVINGVNITNYEKIHKFDTDVFSGVVLDESSILKSYSGKTTQDMINRFRFTPYKLACTATPSPNDYTELGNHAEFLNVMTMNEMLSMFFINDSSHGNGWRLKGHSRGDFFKWIAEWAMMIKSPADFGFDGSKFELPPLNIINEIVESPNTDGDHLFVMPAETLTERRMARKNSLENRADRALKIIEENNIENCLIWCNYNDESEYLSKLIPNAYEIKGSDTDEHKEKGMIGFAKGEVKYLVTKPSICGFGMNWQNCNNMIFCGLSDSFEQFYQAIRRCYRFGQTKAVNVYVITSQAEENILINIKKKEENHEMMSREMMKLLSVISRENLYSLKHNRTNYRPQEKMTLPRWI